MCTLWGFACFQLQWKRKSAVLSALIGNMLKCPDWSINHGENLDLSCENSLQRQRRTAQGLWETYQSRFNWNHHTEQKPQASRYLSPLRALTSWSSSKDCGSQKVSEFGVFHSPHCYHHTSSINSDIYSDFGPSPIQYYAFHGIYWSYQMGGLMQICAPNADSKPLKTFPWSLLYRHFNYHLHVSKETKWFAEKKEMNMELIKELELPFWIFCKLTLIHFIMS